MSSELRAIDLDLRVTDIYSAYSAHTCYLDNYCRTMLRVDCPHVS